MSTTNMEIDFISASPLYNIAEAFTKLLMALTEARERMNNFSYTWEKLEYIIDGEEEEAIENLTMDIDVWDEMSYNCYNEGLLDFRFDEYSNGDWQND